MPDHDDDFMDDYFEYKLFENSMKSAEKKTSVKGRPTSPPPMRLTKPSSDLGCGGWIALICIVIALISVFGSCSKIDNTSYSSSVRSSYHTSGNVIAFFIPTFS